MLVCLCQSVNQPLAISITISQVAITMVLRSCENFVPILSFYRNYRALKEEHSKRVAK